jgi:hypothetical protein
MALIPAKVTKKGQTAAVEGVTQFLGPQLAPALGGSESAAKAHEAGHALAAPHEVYTLDLADVANGLKGAKATGWRYLVMEGDNAVAAAELDRPAKGSKGNPEFSNLNTGGFVSSTYEAIHTAELLPEVKKADYQVRLLQIPAVCSVALWLHGKSQDLLLPLQSSEPGSPKLGGAMSQRPLSPSDFFHSIEEQVKLTSEFDDTPEASRKQAKSTVRKNTTPKPRKPGSK